VSPAGNDLAVLTPPLLVCVAFLIAVGAFLRHEMGGSRRRRDRDASGDISRDDTIPDTAGSQPSTHSDDEGHPEPIDDSPDPQADYGELRASSRLPPLARDVELVSRIGVPSNWQSQEFWYIF
jgi:hypothetical protein